MSALIHPIAPIVAIRTDGYRVNQVTMTCPFCRGKHVHEWFGEPDGLRMPTCGALSMYAITIGVKERIDHMRTEFPAPDGVVGLVPLHISYAYERDGDDDVIGVVLDTALGRFALWLALPDAVALAGQLVTLAEARETLRARYAERCRARNGAASGSRLGI